MKRILLCIVVVTAVVVLGIVNYYYITHNADYFISRISSINEKAEKGEDIEKDCELLSDSWTDFCKCQIFINDNDRIIEITMSVEKLKSVSDSADEIRGECETAIKLLELYAENQHITFANVL